MSARRLVVATTVAALASIGSGLAAGGAAADGLPVVGVDTTRQGVLAPDGQHRYLAWPAGDRTVVAEVESDGGELTEQRTIGGRFTVPGVSLDGTTSGLSRDGSTLVLIKPRVSFPQPETSMVVLDPARLQVRRRINLPGDFSFDALSPDGRTMYVIHYTDPRDPIRYRVRAFDLATGELAPGAIVDASAPDEQMRGYPRTRVTGLDGRWEYTLYDGGGREPFVHALDTVAGKAVCIDMAWIDAREVGRTSLVLSDDGSAIEVVESRKGPVAEIDTATAEATALAASVEPSATPEEGSDAIGLVAIGLVAAAIAGGVALVRRRRVPLQVDEAAEGVALSGR